VHRTQGKPPIAAPPLTEDIEQAVSWVTGSLPWIRAELARSGCLLIRGLPVVSAADFGRVRDVLLPTPAEYKENATPRSNFGHGVYSSTDLPAVQPIRLHNENSYTLEFPGALLFGCLAAPEEGGATTTGDMRMALRLLPSALRDHFAETGWLVVRNYSEMAGLPWQTSFGTEDRGLVEAYCRNNAIEWEWLGDGSLRTRQRRSAIITHPQSGEPVWFNHVAFWNKWTLDPEIRDVLTDTFGEDAMPFGTFFGDGTALSEDEVQTLNRTYDQVTMREAWRPGDVLLVDNILCAHGRDAFRGDRKILVSMGNPVELRECRPTIDPYAAVT
jgi:alpha-ketoglutarate-dependent taurine dioxygenase